MRLRAGTDRTSLTARGGGMLLAAVLLYATSRALGVAELQLAAVAAVGLVAAAALFTWVASNRIAPTRSVRPSRIAFGGSAVSEVMLRNVGRLPTATLEVRDTVPPSLDGGNAATLRPLPRGAVATVSTPLVGAQRGRFVIGPLHVTLRDPFRLVSRVRELPSHAELVVHPPVHRLPAGLPLGGAQSTEGDGSRRPRGSGEDRATVREYVRGDDLRAVHWPSTAHRGKLMVRQPEAPQDPRAVVLLDRRRDRHRGQGPQASLETAIAVAASALCHLAERGRGVVLVDDILTGPLASRSTDVWLADLAEADAGVIDLDVVLHQLARGLAGDGALVTVLTVPTDDELRLLVRAGRAFATRAAVLVDADAHDVRRRSGRAATNAAAEVHHAADQLRAAGWRVAVVGPGDDLPERWQQLLSRRTVTATPTVRAASARGARAGAAKDRATKDGTANGAVGTTAQGTPTAGGR